jgi:Protein of unknown function (DUF2510)
MRHAGVTGYSATGGHAMMEVMVSGLLLADSQSGGAAALLILVMLIFGAAMVGLLVLWIVKLIEVIKLPEAQFKNAASEKLTWVLVVALVGWIGALIWQFGGTRQRVLAAPATEAWGAVPVQAYPATPPGWYPDPQGPGMLRWWDGRTWTEHRQPASPPR